MGSALELESATPSPGVAEMKASRFESGDHATSFPVPGRGLLVPSVGVRNVVSLPSGRVAFRRRVANQFLTGVEGVEDTANDYDGYLVYKTGGALTHAARSLDVSMEVR